MIVLLANTSTHILHGKTGMIDKSSFETFDAFRNGEFDDIIGRNILHEIGHAITAEKLGIPFICIMFKWHENGIVGATITPDSRPEIVVGGLAAEMLITGKRDDKAALNDLEILRAALNEPYGTDIKTISTLALNKFCILCESDIRNIVKLYNTIARRLEPELGYKSAITRDQFSLNLGYRHSIKTTLKIFFKKYTKNDRINLLSILQ